MTASNSAAFVIVPFDPAVHGRDTFASGSTRIDNFLQLTAKKLQRSGSIKLWVALPLGDNQVAGFYAINAAEVTTAELPPEYEGRAPRHGKLPAVYLSMLGVSTRYQGAGLGRALLVDAFKRVLATADQIGVAFLVLDVLDEGGPVEIERRKRFYLRLGFEEFPDQQMSMFITLKKIRHAAGGTDRS